MSDTDTLKDEQGVDTLGNTDNFDDQTVSMEEYAAMKKKAEDQEKARIKFQAENKELKAKIGTPEEVVGQEPKAVTTPDSASEISDLRMEMAGYKSEKEKEVIRAAMKSLGVNEQEAMSNEFVQGKINSMRSEQKVAEATDISGSGAGDTPSNDDLLVRNLKKGVLPTDPAEAAKLMELAKKDPEIEKLILGR